MNPAKSNRHKTRSNLVAMGTTHEDGGAVSAFGETFAADELKRAEQIKRGDSQLQDVSVTTIAHLLRKAGVPAPAT